MIRSVLTDGSDAGPENVHLRFQVNRKMCLELLLESLASELSLSSGPFRAEGRGVSVPFFS